MRRYSSVRLSRVSHVCMSTPCASASLRTFRDKRIRDALREQRLECGKLGAFPSPAITAACLNMIADGHVRPPRRAIRRDDRRLGQHRAIERVCREQRGNALIWNDRSAAARTRDRRQAEKF